MEVNFGVGVDQSVEVIVVYVLVVYETLVEETMYPRVLVPVVSYSPTFVDDP
jgi:hypothetical protein